MNLIEIIFLTGTHCISPLQSGDRVTEVAKVSCAVVVKQDPHSASVEIFPRAAATDPVVIALLGKSIRWPVSPIPAVSFTTPNPRMNTAVQLISSEGELEPQKPRPVAAPAPLVRQVKPQESQEAVGLTVNRKRSTLRKPKDQCGSYRAVWYTNKEGRRKYRCVRS